MASAGNTRQNAGSFLSRLARGTAVSFGLGTGFGIAFVVVKEISAKLKQVAAEQESKDGKQKTVPFPCGRVNDAFKYCVREEYANEKNCTLYSNLIKECGKISA